MDQVASGLEGLPLCLVVGMALVREDRQIVAAYDEQASSELFGVLLELVLGHLACAMGVIPG